MSFVYGKVWLADFEQEREAYAIRHKTPAQVALYRYSVAHNMGHARAAATTRILFRQTAPEPGRMYAFDCTGEGAGERADEVRCCHKCGCTEDRACVTDGVPCAWATPTICTACAS